MAGVVILHGIAGSPLLLRAFDRALRAEGYRTRNLGYPSRRLSLSQIADALAPTISEFAGELDGPLHFVTHSMGGLVVRVLLRRHRFGNLGRVVMLGPPNRGSEIADLLYRTSPYRRALGPAGLQLVTRRDEALIDLLGEIDFELGIIAGDRSLDPVASRLLPRPNDGRVSVEATRDINAADHIVLHTSHTAMPWDPRAIRQTLAFLRSGRFDRSGK
jgi:pimeloyl-ACP methyl ester carboxylesterase